MEADLERLAETAAVLERQVGELRAEVRELTEAVRARAAAEAERAMEAERAAAADAAAAAAAAAAGAGDAADGSGGDDSEARLVAYSMVLDGVPREEVARHLAEELGVSDSEALLDDLYARAGG